MTYEFRNGYNVGDLSTPRRYFKPAGGDRLILVNIVDITEPTMLFVEKNWVNPIRDEYLGGEIFPPGPTRPLESFAFFDPSHRFAPKKSKSKTKKSNTKKSKPKKSKSKKRSLNKKSSDKRKLAGYERFLHTQMKLMKDDPKSDKERMALIRKLHTLIN